MVCRAEEVVIIALSSREFQNYSDVFIKFKDLIAFLF